MRVWRACGPAAPQAGGSPAVWLQLQRRQGIGVQVGSLLGWPPTAWPAAWALYHRHANLLLPLPPTIPCYSGQSVGAGEFLDLVPLVDLCTATGFSLIQVGQGMAQDSKPIITPDPSAWLDWD
jgi:hypothetical protein